MRDLRVHDHRGPQLHARPTPSRRCGPRGPRVPVELIGEIIAHINDKHTLSICARVSSAFYHPAQRQFFSRVTLYFESFLLHYARNFKGRTGPPRNTPKAFYNLLRRAPHLARHVRKLLINVGLEFAGKDERLYLNKLVPFLGELRSLSFPLNDDEFHALMPNNANFTKAMYMPPLSSHQIRNLVELDIGAFSDCQVPDLSFFRKLSGLRQLTMACRFDTDIMLPNKHQQVSMTLGRRPLESLSLAGGRFSTAAALLTSPSFPFEMGHWLRKLHLDPFEFYDRGPIGQLLSFCPNLEEFSQVADWEALASYHFPTGRPLAPYNAACAPPSISLLRNLRSITLHGTISSLPVVSRSMRRVDSDSWCIDKFGHHLQWMVDLLNSIPMQANNRIKVIKIILDIEKYFSTEVAVMDWGLLESAIHPQRFRRLRRVDLELRVARPLNDGSGRTYPQVHDILGQKEYLYGLKRSGIFRMTIVPKA